MLLAHRGTSAAADPAPGIHPMINPLNQQYARLNIVLGKVPSKLDLRCVARRCQGRRTQRATSFRSSACRAWAADSAPACSSWRMRLPYCCRKEKISSADMCATSSDDTAWRPHPAAKGSPSGCSHICAMQSNLLIARAGIRKLWSKSTLCANVKVRCNTELPSKRVSRES